MHFKSQLMLAAAAAAAINHVEVRQVNVVHVLEKLHVYPNAIVNYTLNKREEAALVARADRDECQSSVVDILKGAPTGDADLEDWAYLYVPSSLSEDMMEYMTSYIVWAADAQDDVEDFNKECSQYVDGDVVDACPTPGTIFFTENNATETVALDSLVACITAGSGDDDEDNAAASRDRSLIAAVAAAVGVVGVMMAL